jgi:hypothetical protein
VGGRKRAEARVRSKVKGPNKEKGGKKGKRRKLFGGYRKDERQSLKGSSAV